MRTTFGRLLATPGAPAFTASALVSRLPLSMAALGIVLLVTDHGGSYGEAGLVSAAYVIAAAVFAPVHGRLADQLGQALLCWVGGAGVAVGLTLVVLSVRDEWANPLPHACAALAGAFVPQTSSFVRARWSHVLRDDRSLLGTAFAWEAVLDEVVFVVGPVLVTFLTLHVADWSGLGVTAAAATLGAWAFALQRRTAPPRGQHTRATREPLGWDRLAPLVVASVGLGVLFGSTEVLVVAFTDEAGNRGASGLVLAVWAFGSLLAGTIAGARPAADPLARLRWTSVVLTASFIPLTLVAGIPLLTAAIFVTGFMVAPTLIAATALVEACVAPSRLTEALTWTTTGLAVGVAPGAAVSGAVVDRAGASAGFLVPLVAAALATLVVWAFSRRISPAIPLVADPVND
ncbi:MAG: MFS transporter [Aeromicrobium erythreum]